jgi:predicted transposase YdaD
MNIAEHLHEEGRKKGREEGREEGRIATLRSLLVFKFQTVGAEFEARLQAATPEAIDSYLQRLLTADSLAAVFGD